MDLSAIIDEFNRRKAQAGQSISDMFTPPQKPANWFQQMQQGQNAVINPQQRDNINRELADMVERFTAGMVPEPIRARERAMRTDPSAAAKPFTSEEVKGITPFVTAAAPIAYHGTPHQFDKFDASKIGTGQGAQSYGHGLYFAENPQVAEEYKRTITKLGWQKATQSTESEAGIALNYLDSTNGDVQKAISNLKSGLGKTQPELANSVIKELQSGNLPSKGNTYQVNIPDQHAARMLDWDKPLSEQPEIEKLLPSLGFKQTVEGHWQGPYGGPISRTNPMGGEMVVSAVGNSERGSRLLQQAGIPGIKYLDQGSRTAGQGTRNFVVFDPAILEDVTRK